MEVKIHNWPHYLLKLLNQIFPQLTQSRIDNSDIRVITFWQKTNFDMSCFSTEVEDERDKLSEKFIEISNIIYEKLKNNNNNNYWCDIIDPRTNQPHFGLKGNGYLAETDDVILLLGYSIMELGCCKIVWHSNWKNFSFLSFLFTNAPNEILIDLIPNLII
eukprot:TRINITY_DN2176_c1_g1_i1.p1 TRINITY_DN2176_c1_g1~~TRINITY_DN2176_c1_g1_i1.p1  ORF type:complete len:161 (+),score=55.98 TRINITY_DN2176_c1_g1_i1:107-589(+)